MSSEAPFGGTNCACNPGEPLEHFGHERVAARLAQAMARKDSDAMDRILKDAKGAWGFDTAVEIDARAQELVALAQELTEL